VSAERFAEIGAEARQARTAKAAEQREALRPTVERIRAKGAVSLRQIAAELNAQGVPTPRGGEWSAVQVSRVL